MLSYDFLCCCPAETADSWSLFTQLSSINGNIAHKIIVERSYMLAAPLHEASRQAHSSAGAYAQAQLLLRCHMTAKLQIKEYV